MQLCHIQPEEKDAGDFCFYAGKTQACPPYQLRFQCPGQETKLVAGETASHPLVAAVLPCAAWCPFHSPSSLRSFGLGLQWLCSNLPLQTELQGVPEIMLPGVFPMTQSWAAESSGTSDDPLGQVQSPALFFLTRTMTEDRNFLNINGSV